MWYYKLTYVRTFKLANLQYDMLNLKACDHNPSFSIHFAIIYLAILN